MKIDDRVKYTSGYWGDGRGNPLWNGRYGCIKGIITDVNERTIYPNFVYDVRWDNGVNNGYYERDLELLETELNTMFDDIIDNL